MTLDTCVALSLIEHLPRRGLTARLLADDPHLEQLAAPSLARARAVCDQAQRDGLQPLPWTDPRFPAVLHTIPDCPPLLWCRGRLDALDAPRVAVVGSRAASALARETASRIAEGLASAGVVVVSGLARGVDSAAHRGALRTGRTIAVLGSGHGQMYPPEHAPLAGEIAVTGLVISELPPDRPPLPCHFPLRNRLISGLSAATVVVEAAEQSGSLITAGCAVDQGREVLVVPGPVAGGRNRGGHALIRDGATLVETAEDILEHLGWRRAAAGRTAGGAGDEPGGDPGDPILQRMAPGEVCSVEHLATDTGIDTVRLLCRLSELEVTGRVCRVPGGGFVRSW